MVSHDVPAFHKGLWSSSSCVVQVRCLNRSGGSLALGHNLPTSLLSIQKGYWVLAVETCNWELEAVLMIFAPFAGFIKCS